MADKKAKTKDYVVTRKGYYQPNDVGKLEMVPLNTTVKLTEAQAKGAVGKIKPKSDFILEEKSSKSDEDVKALKASVKEAEGRATKAEEAAQVATDALAKATEEAEEKDAKIVELQTALDNAPKLPGAK